MNAWLVHILIKYFPVYWYVLMITLAVYWSMYVVPIIICRDVIVCTGHRMMNTCCVQDTAWWTVTMSRTQHDEQLLCPGHRMMKNCCAHRMMNSSCVQLQRPHCFYRTPHDEQLLCPGRRMMNSCCVQDTAWWTVVVSWTSHDEELLCPGHRKRHGFPDVNKLKTILDIGWAWLKAVQDIAWWCRCSVLDKLQKE